MKYKLILNNKFFKVLFFIYLLLKPFYFFDSGGLQLSDYIIFPTILLYFFINRPFQLFKERYAQYLLGFLIIVFIVNGYYIIVPFETYQWVFLRPILYYSYNAALFIFCISLFKSFVTKDFIGLLMILFVSVGVQFLLILLDIDKGVINNFKGRDYNYFNNPNQLAYYSLLLLTFVFIIRNKVLKVPYVVTLTISLSLVVIICSTSFPALVGGVFFLLIYISYILKKDFIKHLILLLFPLLILVVVKNNQLPAEYERILNRFEKPQLRAENSITDRGYGRVFEFPQYLIFGAGEGKFDRFVPKRTERPQEIHNTFISVFFNYGILGGILFLLFFYFAFEKINKRTLLFLIPIIIYNLLHNGIRFSLIWVLMAYIFYASRLDK